MTIRRGIALLLFVALVVGVAVLGYLYQGSRTMDGLRTEALDSARQYTEELSTYDYATPTTNLDRVIASSTDDFATDYRDVSTSLTDLLTQGQGRATGHAVTAGIVEIDGEHAVVAVFLDQEVSNLAVPDGRTDSSRMLIGLERSGDRWLLASADPA